MYLYMIKVKILLAFRYRFEFFTQLFSKIVLLFATTYFWQAAYSGLDSVASVTRQQMLIYSVVSIVLGSVFAVQVENNIRQRVRKGDVAVDFIKPINVFLMYFAEDIGDTVNAWIQGAVPVLIVSALFIVVPAPASGLSFLLFFVSAAFSYLILWLLSAIFGLFYFWFIDMGPIGTIKNYLVMILSGAFVPIWFFPAGLQNVLRFLPFIYTYQHPIGIFIGRTPLDEALLGMAVQLVWVCLFFLLFRLLHRRMTGKVLVQGG